MKKRYSEPYIDIIMSEDENCMENLPYYKNNGEDENSADCNDLYCE